MAPVDRCDEIIDLIDRARIRGAQRGRAFRDRAVEHQTPALQRKGRLEGRGRATQARAARRGR